MPLCYDDNIKSEKKPFRHSCKMTGNCGCRRCRLYRRNGNFGERKMKKLLAGILCDLTCFGTAASTAFAELSERVLFVSPVGNDSADGSFSAPLATLLGAKEKAKTLGGNVTVYFREGTYTVDKTVNFDKTDCPNVTFKAYGDERAVLTAGNAYTGFEECTVNGVRALKKDVGTSADFNILLDDASTLSLTRYPESGYLYVNGVSDTDIATEVYSWDYFHMPCRGMLAEKNDIPEFKNITDVVIKLLHYWKDETLRITSFDAATGHIGFNKLSSMIIEKNNRYFLLNVFEMLKKPGQWYLDKTEGILYVIPRDDVDADTYTVWGSSLDTMISVDGVNGISFENLIFRGNGFSYNNEREGSQAAYNAVPCVSFKNTRDFSVRNCEFRDIAGGAVYFGEAVQNGSADSCLFHNIGAQAVFIKGLNIPADDERVTKNITVTNNIISEFGKVNYNAVAVLVIDANTVEVSHNEIHDGYYTAISVGWVWGYDYSVTYNNKICDNLIYNIGQGWLSDMGGIYTLGNQPGTVISGNVIHNVAADPEEGGYGGWGIYLDEGSSYILAEKNLVYACGSDGYHLHYGSYNTVRNNIFALNGDSQVRVVSNIDRVAPKDGGKKTLDFYNNIVLTDNSTRAVSFIHNKETWAEKHNFYRDLSKGCDIYVDLGDNPGKAMGINTAVRKGYITDPVAADPLFKDAKAFDFELSPSSPAVREGFEAWDYGSAGTVKGTLVGVSVDGGGVPYNAFASAVPMTPSKEKHHLFMELLYRLTGLEPVSVLTG